MLKKMRWRFIASSMAAFLAVTLVLLCGVNLWNHKLAVDWQNDMLERLMSADRADTKPFDSDSYRLPGLFNKRSKEMRYTLRFFTIRCDPDGTLISVNQGSVLPITDEEAANYASDILGSQKEFGYYDSYRFHVEKSDSEIFIALLNVERELQSERTLLLTSAIVSAVGLLTVFGLVVLFSRSAIAPYIRNIEVQKQFITDAGHELKTPLTSISTSADILAMENPDDEWIQNIQNQSIRLSKMVTNLVELSRLDEAQPFPIQSEFSLSEAIWEISEPMAVLAKAHGKEYSQEIEDGLTLRGDRSAIQQAVSILLDNAVRYSNDGGKIHLCAHKQKKRIEISVFNTCSQIDTQHIDRLFDRFYRPDQSRNANSGGSGIGLSIAKATVEAHGGKIKAESKTGESVTFKILF